MDNILEVMIDSEDVVINLRLKY